MPSQTMSSQDKPTLNLPSAAAEPPRDAPSLSLPKSGGAIRGMGEKFTTNPVTGTASFSIPLGLTNGRGVISPVLSLSYDSGAGNGPFGLGWDLAVPSVSRTTDRGVPQYCDTSALDGAPDTFQLSGAEDLVPIADGGHRVEGDFEIHAYRPRTEGLFARIERWRHTTSGDSYWRATTPGNVTSVYGRAAAARVHDPADPRRVFRWLLQETFDDLGNVVEYEYKPEDSAGVDPAAPHERNRLRGEGRTHQSVGAQRYLKRIRYGNTVPGRAEGFRFEAVLDYGEHDQTVPLPEETRPWPVRLDPFSMSRSGFEVRTYRLCRRILMFHRFAELSRSELGEAPTLVAATELRYDENPALTYLTAATRHGYVRTAEGGYTTDHLPPVTFDYTRREMSTEARPLTGPIGSSPVRLDAGQQWTDLDGEGIGGVLAEQGGAWFYRANLGSGRVAEPVAVGTLPALRAASGHQLMDVTGEGRQALVDFSGGTPGYHRRTEGHDWDDFVPFASLPQLNWSDPNLRFVDLTGDGLSDLLLTADDGLTWYAGAGGAGFSEERWVSAPASEERGPRLVFADAEHSVHLADMTGDGLTDLVRIGNGEVAYWPNLGHGRFGPKVTMAAAPVFDHPDHVDYRRIQLADVDGSAPTDIVYSGRDGIRVWFNQAGNSWSAPVEISTPAAPSGVSVADVLGRGTACLVIAEPRPEGEPHIRYIDLMAAGKPHLLRRVENGTGLVTTIGYESSASYYLADKAAGRPWVTRPAFPVQVVATVETHDAIADTTLFSEYSYRHGYYDGAEREFRGFGYVEQRDVPSYAAGSAGTEARSESRGVAGLEGRLIQPPTVTKRWQHTGWYSDANAVSSAFRGEYFGADSEAGAGPLLADTVLPGGLTADEEREAARALRGLVLREEVYAEDGQDAESTERQRRPYLVTEHSYDLRILQSRGAAEYCVVHAHPAETVTIHTERQTDDPRITHEFTLDVDEWGNVVRSASVAYPRRVGAVEFTDTEQRRLWVTVTEADVVNDVGTTDRWRIGVPVATRSYEIGGVFPPEGELFTKPQLVEGLAAAESLPTLAFHEELSGSTPQRRLISRTLATYAADDLAAELSPGQVGVRALPWRSYQQAFAPGQVEHLYDQPVSNGNGTDALLAEAGYVRRPDDPAWWMPSARSVFDPDHFYLPTAHHDPFGAVTEVTYDAPHYLAPVRVTDPVGNVMTAQLNYRMMQPWLLTDPNGNRSGVRFDALGMVTATAAMGKAGAGSAHDNEGDLLDLSTPEPSPADDPTARLRYDLRVYGTAREPVWVRTEARERHRTDEGGAESRRQESVVYTDGTGRAILTKVQAEPGPAPVRGPDGKLKRNPDGSLVVEFTEHRWVGTGRVIHDNKGQPVKRYEPYFAPDDRFDTEADLVHYGVTPILRYDPLGRLVETEYPDGTRSFVTFNAWEQQTWDRNDAVLGTRWYAERIQLPESDPAGRAARLAATHAGTFTEARFDSLGRPYLTIADNGHGELFRTGVERDVQGNERAVIDARELRVLESDFDMLGRPAHTRSVDAGERWSLPDVMNKPVYARDGRGTVSRWRHDQLRRVTHGYATVAGETERLRVRVLYGESLGDAAAHNLRGRPYLSFDGAGLVRTVDVDFKGNSLTVERRLVIDPVGEPDWVALADVETPAVALAAAEGLLDETAYGNATEYDALNRPTLLTAPDGTRTRPTYNEANLLERVEVRSPGSTEWLPTVVNLDYNARGQRVFVELGCGAKTGYEYQPDTFRLSRLYTTSRDGRLLQGLSFAYDPTGNITEIGDAAQQPVFFANTVVSSDRRYEYDATYRLVAAEGREHIGQTATEQPGPEDPTGFEIPHVNDEQAMRRYRETYAYDPVGNFRSMTHKTQGPTQLQDTWERRYDTAPDSNRLRATSLPGDLEGQYSARYAYDDCGNLVEVPHLRGLGWDAENRLTRADLAGTGTAHYQYDAGGQRVRATVTDGGTTETRIYIGQFELYRKTVAGNIRDERETLHVMDGAQRVALIETTTREAGRPPAGGPRRVERYQLADQLGSAAVELSGDGSVLSYEEFHPYGTTSFRSAAGAAETSLKRYRFTGKEKDVETGFYYHGARYCAPWLGRWTAPDPAGLVDGPNRYAYVRNDPVGLQDPSGHAGEGGPQSRSGWDTAAEVGLGLLDILGDAAFAIHDFMRAKSPEEIQAEADAEYDANAAEYAKGSNFIEGGRNVLNRYNPFYQGGKTVEHGLKAAQQGDLRTYTKDMVGAGLMLDGAVRGGGGKAGRGPAPAAAATPEGVVMAVAEAEVSPTAVAGKGGAFGPPVLLQASGSKDKPGSGGGKSIWNKSLTAAERQGVTNRIREANQAGKPVKWSTEESGLLRSEARWVWEQISGKPIPKGYQVHHRHALEHADLFPEQYPNDPANLELVPQEIHENQIHGPDAKQLAASQPRSAANVEALAQLLDQSLSKLIKRPSVVQTLPSPPPAKK